MTEKRYCEMCDRFVPANQTECKTCGAQTVKADPVRVELPPVRVKGFDRLFKRLGEVLAPDGEKEC